MSISIPATILPIFILLIAPSIINNEEQVFIMDPFICLQPYVGASVYMYKADTGSGWPVFHCLGTNAFSCTSPFRICYQ